MSTKPDDTDGTMTESCESCDRNTPHDVSIELRTESQRTENAEYSREPYRVAACRLCGAEQSIRMNNA
ncbi:MAG: hypothetical protein RI560_12095 [Natronomonas sp.]|jgi:hypothetical protein|uniref:DUF7835 domain-containing protein n=1 Tax=Natronomonas salsuginis TaxID=2217661 RepID=A0A4U5JBQ6_9EURY|nr:MULTISPECIES: hypothetical protein [Natronomonas]MDR9382395.1 hypothetical protein [Natronomonas sp.]MDR9431694.1 hypothetical protein [Natronomonas sp.]TKR26045.1 hypothetical protein DM868_06000 [Natronomonas salsuginis]